MQGGNYRTGAASSITTARPFIKTLHDGWNFFSSPFDFNLPLEAISLSENVPLNVQSYTGAWNTPSDIVPFQGYIIDAGFGNGTVTMSIDPNGSADKTASKHLEEVAKKEELAWFVRIDAECEHSFDWNNRAGIARTASKSWDTLDRPEPLVIGDYVSVYFPHTEWDHVHKRFETDVRPDPFEGDVWEFEVATAHRDVVTLRFTGLEYLPKRIRHLPG